MRRRPNFPNRQPSPRRRRGAVNAEDNNITLRDVSVQPKTDDHDGAVAFALSNVDPTNTERHLQRISVDGQEVKVDGNKDLKPQCQIVGNNEKAIEAMGANDVHTNSSASESAKADPNGEARINCVSYVHTTFDGTPTPGTAVNVTFTLDSGEVSMKAPVAASVPEAGKTTRDNEGVLKDEFKNQ